MAFITDKEKSNLLREIRDQILVLEKSPLYSYRKKNNFLPVIGEGSQNAKIMFIGEAPGKNEALSGRPFCGTAGKVLDELFKSIDIKKETVYITNIIKDRPPENRDPTSREIEVYGPFLDKQIEIIQPKVIVTLGRYAMNYIMNKFGLQSELKTIGVSAGKIYFAKTSYGEIDIVTLYHPCVAVYNPHNIGRLKTDFRVLAKYK